jgi:hypothetical protein
MIASVNAGLQGPEREVLALLAESGLGYAGIAELLGIDRAGVAEIAARARLRLAGVEVAAGCHGHLARLAARIDGEDLGGPERSCPHCASALEAMRAADAAYRAWDPGEMPPELRERW